MKVPSSYRVVFAKRPFRRLLPGFIISSIGDGMSIVAVAWLGLELAPQGFEGITVGASVAAFALPGAIGGLFLERQLGRIDGRRLVMADCAARAVCLGAIPFLLWFDALSVASYISLLALSSILHAWGIGGRDAMIASLIPHEQWFAANALLGTVLQGSWVIGPALAGLVIVRHGAVWVIGIDAATYVILGLLLIRTQTQRGVPIADSRPPSTDTAIRELLRHRDLRGLLALTFVFYFVYGPLDVALPLYVARDLGEPASFFGLAISALGIGALIGALIAGAIRSLPLFATAVAIVAAWGAAVIAPGFVLSAGVLVAALAVGGFFYGPYEAVTATALQDNVPPERLAAVSAAWRSTLLIATPAGTLIGGPMVETIGSRATLVVSGVTTLVFALLVMVLTRWRPVRQSNALPQSPAVSSS